MTNQEFFSLCSTHDWYYQYSEDSGVYNRGHTQSVRLSRLAGTNPTFAKIYKDWCLYINPLKEMDIPKVENY